MTILETSTIERSTAEYASRFPQSYFRKLATGETVSRIGFGTYRTAIGIEAHENALRKALLSGINLIDTASNYAFGDSEILIGSTLEDLIAEGSVSADELVIVTKSGYIQGEILEEAKRGELEGRRIPGVVKLEENVWHSIHPFFIAEQLNQSLERLNLLHINVLLLHNPEYYLAWAQSAGNTLESAREEFYRKMRLAFEYCEKAVSNAKISWYGISSNSLGYMPEHYQFCALDKCYRIAEDIAGSDHHFRFAQLPLNLLETGAAVHKNQENGELTCLEFAQKFGISVLANRPLNALSGGSTLVRLTTQATTSTAPEPKHIEHLIEQTIDHERMLFSELLSALDIPQNDLFILRGLAATGEATKILWKSLPSFADWSTVLLEQFEPRANQVISYLQQINTSDISEWLFAYIPLLQEMWNNISTYYTSKDTPVSLAIKRSANAAFGKEYGLLPMTQLALQTSMNSEGISSTLMGARSVAYIDDALTALESKLKQLHANDWKSYLAAITQSNGN